MKRFFYDNRVLLLAMTVLMALTACDDNESYADKLNEERNAVNAYLANHRLVMSVPEDTVFEVGENAPFYRIDPDGNVYMQVIKAGDRKNPFISAMLVTTLRPGMPTALGQSPAVTRIRWTPPHALSITWTTPCPHHLNGVMACSIRCCSWAWNVK